jgi:hypothetical protein
MEVKLNAFLTSTLHESEFAACSPRKRAAVAVNKNVAVNWRTFLRLLLEVWASNLGPDINKSEKIIFGCHQLLYATAGIF